jgi:DnaK suppressor protein
MILLENQHDRILDTEVISDCKKRLLVMKEELLNRLRNNRLEISIYDKMSGDEADQTVAQMMENSFSINQKRVREQLMEIEYALSRMQKGTFGICEETSEPIEVERLIAIPYTRFSIEGAEIRDALKRKFAR